MTDKELLELAAKAAGYRANSTMWTDGLWVSDNEGRSWHEWNPLREDGAAAAIGEKME